MKKLLETISNLVYKLTDPLFYPDNSSLHVWINRIGVATLYLIGLLGWCLILDWGRIPFEYHDWAEGHVQRYVFVQDAVNTGQFPLHMPDKSALRNVTDRYLAIADTLFTPQLYLLRVMDIGAFVLTNTLFLYSLGFVGLCLIRRKYKLTLLPFAAMFILMNFNGQLVAHITVGHEIWWSFFLMPYIVLGVLDLVDETFNWRWIAGMSFVMFFMFLQGSFHLIVWSLMFIALLGIFNPKRFFIPALSVGAFTILLSMVRVIPPAITSGFDKGFIGGFVSLTDLLIAMVTRRIPCDSPECSPIFTVLGWMEYDYFVGFVGLVFIIVCGVILWKGKSNGGSTYKELWLPTLGMVLISLEGVYNWISQIPVPPLNSERVSSRMFIIPLAVLCVMGAIHFERYLRGERKGILERLIYIFLLAFSMRDIWLHDTQWAVNNLGTLFPPTAINLSNIPVSNHPDPAYTTGLIIGGVVSALTLIFLAFMVFREYRHAAKSNQT